MKEKNTYLLKTELLARKYSRIMKDFEKYHDDRKLAANMYHQLITACDEMKHIGNTFIRVAFNNKFKEQEAEIEHIVARFTDTTYNSDK